MLFRSVSRDVVGLAVKLFQGGARFVAGEMGPTLPPGEPPIVVWAEKLPFGRGQMGSARMWVKNDMEESTLAPVWDTVVTLDDHPVMWLESHRSAVKNDSLDLPAVRVITAIREEPFGTYRWSSTLREERPGALELVNRLLQLIETR